MRNPPYHAVFPHSHVVLLRAQQTKTRLLDTWGHDRDFSPLQSSLAQHVACYRDVCFPARTHDNAEEIMDLYCMHALNHVLKCVRLGSPS